MEDSYADSRAFVKKMRALAKNRDLASIRQAVQQMQDWMRDHPADLYVGTALEEAARMVEDQYVSFPAESIAKVS